MNIKQTLALATVLGAMTWSLAAQDNNGPGEGRPPGGGHGHRPPPSPLIGALDANHDHVIDAKEIANASAALATLDKDGDGILTTNEYQPPLPPNFAGNKAHPLRIPAVLKALDADGDGIISAAEIANAPAVLKALDKNGDGQLTQDEFDGPRPARPSGAGGDNANAADEAPPGPPPGNE